MRSAKQDCPLCKVAAEFRMAHDGKFQGKYFICVSCKEFVVTGEAEANLNSSSVEKRRRNAERSRNQSDDYLWFMFMPPVVKHEGFGTLGDFQGESQLKSLWRPR